MFESKPFIISGPCSAESLEQMKASAKAMNELDIKAMRCGIWKPRSRPGVFEGAGVEGLKWAQEVQRDYDLKVFTEVILKEHVEQCLDHEINHFWIGARTTTNPYLVEEISKTIADRAKVILVKNPIAPDLKLWLGAIERIEKYNPNATVFALHRGFSTYSSGEYRNDPLWDIVFHLKEIRPDLKIINDPSHIAGKAELVDSVAYMASNLGLDGLFIESHPQPELALTDSAQQLNFGSLKNLIKNLPIKKANQQLENDDLNILRDQIDIIDREILKSLQKRQEVIEVIGELKKENKLEVFSLNRYQASLRDRVASAEKMGLSTRGIEQIYRIIHSESVKKQLLISLEK